MRAYPEPMPLRLPPPDLARRLRRSSQILTTFGRNLAPLGVRRITGKPRSLEVAAALKRSFDDLGGTFLKLAQIIASAPGMFSEEISEVFRASLDTGPAVPIDEIIWTIETELGRPVNSVFEHIDAQPLGCASLAVVHRARTTDGREVAVKILRPGIEGSVSTDLALMAPLFKRLADVVGAEVVGAIDNALDGLQEQLREELDLRNELRTMDHHRGLLQSAASPSLLIPLTFPEMSSRRMLTMSYLDGVALDDAAGAERIGADPRHLTREIIRYWFASVLRDGTFHADIHAGNLLATRDGRLGLLDWGIVGRLDTDTHLFFRSAVGAMLGQEDAWDEVVEHLEKVYGSDLLSSMDGSFDVRELLRGVFEPFFTEPFSAFTLAQLMQQMPQAQGIGAGRPRRSLGDLRRNWRDNRRLRRMGQDKGVREMPFNRGMMMLIKQLLYFDRYGHLFLGDTALLDDADFYRNILEDS